MLLNLLIIIMNSEFKRDISFDKIRKRFLTDRNSFEVYLTSIYEDIHHCPGKFKSTNVMCKTKLIEFFI